MRRTPIRWRLFPCLLLFLPACADDPVPLGPGEPQLDAQSSASITVRVRNPNGDPVCTGLPNNTPVTIGWYEASPEDGTDDVVVTCPTSHAVIPFEAPALREWFVKVEGGSFPSFQIGPTAVWSADTTLHFRMQPGLALNGRAFLDNVPFAGEDLVRFRAYGQHLEDEPAGYASSDVDGTWIDPVTRLPLHLQRNREYTRECRPGLGMRFGAGPDGNAVDAFPAGFRAVDCRFRTSRAQRWTHHATDLQVTPEAGVIEPMRGAEADGRGFPVAYPTGGALTFGRSLIEYGALVFAIDGLGQIWTPWDRADLTHCNSSDPVACAMYEVTHGPVTVIEGVGRRVVWQMADTGNGAARFRFVQRSWDGAYGDYVLFRITVRNETAEHRTVHPAWFLDWNVGHASGEPGTDLGGASPDGRLLYVNDGTRWFGTYLIDSHAVIARWVGNCCSLGATLAAANDILRGFAITVSSRGPGDLTTVHGTRLQVPAGAARSFWIAMVAGGSMAELQAAAAQAQAEADVRIAGGTP